MSTIPEAVRRVKDKLFSLIPEDQALDICRSVGHSWRHRDLTPSVTAALFLMQVLHGNTAVGELRRQSGLGFTESAYCQARRRLPLAFFERLAATAATYLRLFDPPRGGELWLGHRAFLLDGSSFSMPDTPELQAAFGQPARQALGCGFPTAHLLAQFCAATGYLTCALASRGNTHDLAYAALTHLGLSAGDVVVGDRAFCSYAHLALLRRRKLHGLFRAHQRTVICFRAGRRHAAELPQGQRAGAPTSKYVRRLGRHDQLVEYQKPAARPDWMSQADYDALPQTLVVRELRFRVRAPGRRVRVVTVVTTLLDADRYPKRKLAKLYEARWRAETNLLHLKQTLGMDVLRCKSYHGVMKELFVYVLAYNLVRQVMLQAARRQGAGADRVSFVDALRWYRESAPGEALPRLNVNPDRPGRVEPRARKRRPKQYDLLNRPRAEMRERLEEQRNSA